MKYSLAFFLIVLLTLSFIQVSLEKSVSALKTNSKTEIGNNKNTKSKRLSSVLNAMNNVESPKTKQEQKKDLDRSI